MHYYTFNIADYRKDTGHLSTLEHGIYRQLLDWYYLEEVPIPKETQTVIRRLRLGSDSDIQSLQNVLNDFFILQDDGYHQLRCDDQIEKYHDKAEVNKVNGKLGGRPKKTQSVILAKPTQSETKGDETLTINHKPRTINQEPVIDAAPKGSAKAKRLSGDWVLPKEWGLWTVDNMKWDAATVRFEADKFKDFWMAKAGRDAAKADWYATWRNWCRNSKTEAKPTVSNFAGGI